MPFDRVEHAESEIADGLVPRSVADRVDHDFGDDVVGGRGEQISLVLDVVVNRPAPGRETRRERTERQCVLPVGVEDLDRRVDDPFLR